MSATNFEMNSALQRRSGSDSSSAPGYYRGTRNHSQTNGYDVGSKALESVTQLGTTAVNGYFEGKAKEEESKAKVAIALSGDEVKKTAISEKEKTDRLRETLEQQDRSETRETEKDMYVAGMNYQLELAKLILSSKDAAKKTNLSYFEIAMKLASTDEDKKALLDRALKVMDAKVDDIPLLPVPEPQPMLASRAPKAMLPARQLHANKTAEKNRKSTLRIESLDVDNASDDEADVDKPVPSQKTRGTQPS